MSIRPRCRFAPSPTGYLHVGGARTVLFNWLFARQQGGELLLRIEDTDIERNRPELTDNILRAIEWLGLGWDDEPVHQSDRVERHRQAAEQLLDGGLAYWSEAQPLQQAGQPPVRRMPDRDAGLEPGPGRALRFRTPDDGTTRFSDLIRGEVVVEHADIEDFVLMRSNGTPTFLLANSLDDADMGITHVLRGEEHVNGTPKYLLIADALGLDFKPTFAHLPILVDEGRKKLSKRKHSVAVEDFRDRGVLPEAIVNYLALLGWGPPDGVEIRPLEEIVELFRLDDVNPSPAFFDERKLAHINAEYIRALPVDEFLARVEPFLEHPAQSRQPLRALAAEVQERVRTLAEAEGYVDFLWLDRPVIDEASWQKAMVKDSERAAAMLDATLAAWADAPFDAEALRSGMERAALKAGYVNAEGNPQLAKAQAPVRVALTGRTVGPPLFESVVALGRDPTLARLRAARERLG
ncbi:MAG: glutamate--tRNA ligase [Acidimicrobiales bacterium]